MMARLYDSVKIDKQLFLRERIGLEDGSAVLAQIKLLDHNEEELCCHEEELYVENKQVELPFKIESIAKDNDVELDEIHHIIAAIDIDSDGKMTKREEVKLNIAQALHVIILVAGTTDPVNINSKKVTRSQSCNTEPKLDLEAKTLRDKLAIDDYKKEAKNYWDAKFYSQMQTLSKGYKNCELFPYHGWTGDNSIKNREVAGAYLVNRLCGAEDETPYYEETYQNKKIYFHLVGHSHGGNVMNEMTKQMDKLGSRWPKEWKVKSMTYLSTPFFNELHQVKVTNKTFHEKAEVLSLYNDYDLTQRVIADFSMHMLDGIAAVLEKYDIKTVLKEVGEAYKRIPTNKLTDIYFSDAEGKYFYDKIIKFFESIQTLIKDYIIKILDELNQEIEYPLAEYFKENCEEGTFSTKRQILDDSAYKELKAMFEEINDGVATLKDKFQKTIDIVDVSYSRPLFFTDLSSASQLFDTLNRFLDIDENLLSHQPTSLWNILFKVLNHNIEKYDNTYVKPDKQFADLSVTNIQVRDKDKYDIKTRQAKEVSTFTRTMINSQSYGLQSQKDDDILEPKVFSERYYKFIENIESIEGKQDSTQLSQANLREMLFSLLAQSPLHTMIDRWAGVGLFGLGFVLNDEADKSLTRLKMTIDKLKRLFDERYVGELEAFGMGSLDYFMRESHSTSRRVLHDDVKEFLTRLGARR